MQVDQEMLFEIILVSHISLNKRCSIISNNFTIRLPITLTSRPFSMSDARPSPTWLRASLLRRFAKPLISQTTSLLRRKSKSAVRMSGLRIVKIISWQNYRLPHDAVMIWGLFINVAWRVSFSSMGGVLWLFLITNRKSRFIHFHGVGALFPSFSFFGFTLCMYIHGGEAFYEDTEV